MKSVTLWINKWKENNWKNAKGKSVENQDIIKKIDKYLQTYSGKYVIKWLPSHTGNNDQHSIGNSIADRLAKQGAMLNV